MPFLPDHAGLCCQIDHFTVLRPVVVRGDGGLATFFKTAAGQIDSSSSLTDLY